MRAQTELLIRKKTEKRHRQRRWLAFMTALSVLTGSQVFWNLRSIGTALTDSELCPIRAHTHSAGCYDEKGVLTCALAEHIHQASCFSDPAADKETADIWELTLPAPTVTSRQERTALIAESQLGYTESDKNFISGEDGIRQGYSRYGEWYGNPYGEWNTMFTYFCLYYAGFTREDLPFGGNAAAWQVKLSEDNLLRPPEKDIQRGCAVLLDPDGDGQADRTGIITGTDGALTVIQGDQENAVAAVQYAPDDAAILGYVRPAEPETAPAAEPQPEQLLFQAGSPSGIQVDASADAGVFPEGTVMTVADVSREEAIQAAAEGLSADESALDAVAVDISFYSADGIELEPDGTVNVAITLPAEMHLENGDYALLHVSDRGEITAVENAGVTAEGAQFEAESFSIYVVTSNGTARDKQSMVMANGLRGNNSESNPYVLGVGEPIEVWYEGDDYRNCWFTVSGNDYGSEHRIVRDDSFFVGEHSTLWYGADCFDDNKLKARFIGSTPSKSGENMHIVVQKKDTDNNTVTVENLYLRVVDNPVYMYVDEERLELATALTNLNSPDKDTIYLVEGESFTLSANGENHGDYFSAADSSLVSMGTPVSHDGYTDVTFTAGAKHGTTTVSANGKTITVITEHPIYVKDTNGERDIDRINEWLAIYAAGTKHNGYHLNKNDPYRVYADDTITLRVPVSDVEGAELVIDNSRFEVVSGSLTPDSTGNINVTLKALNDTGADVTPNVTLKNGNEETIRSMRVMIRPKQQDLLDHADIEIADGGKYTVTSLKRDADGNITKVITVYRAYVSGVNKSTLYQSADDSDTCQMYWTRGTWLDPDGVERETAREEKVYEMDENGNPKVDKDGNPIVKETLHFYTDDSGNEVQLHWGDVIEMYDRSEVTGYRSDQYHVDPAILPGTPQYEFTSKYEPIRKANGSVDYINWSNTKFYPSDVDHVVFDVQLTLEPETRTEYTQSGSDWVPGTSVSISDEPNKILNSVMFNMDHQAVLDAYNKCPNHTGLDFTIMANSALIELVLNKKLTGGTVQNGQFSFELVSKETGEVIQTVTNDANGLVTFDALHFEKTGTFNYIIREVKPQSNRDNILYDSAVKDLEVVVEAVGTQLIANMITDVNTLEFTNKVAYSLPETGGSGTLPYCVCGTVFIAASLMLVVKKRRERV